MQSGQTKAPDHIYQNEIKEYGANMNLIWSINFFHKFLN